MWQVTIDKHKLNTYTHFEGLENKKSIAKKKAQGITIQATVHWTEVQDLKKDLGHICNISNVTG